MDEVDHIKYLGNIEDWIMYKGDKDQNCYRKRRTNKEVQGSLIELYEDVVLKWKTRRCFKVPIRKRHYWTLLYEQSISAAGHTGRKWKEEEYGNTRN